MKLSKREKILISVLIILTVSVLYIFYLLLPKYEDYKENTAELNSQKQIVQELILLRDSNKLEEEKNEILKELNDINNSIPSDVKLPILYMDLLGIKNKSKVDYEVIQFGNPQKVIDKIYENNTYLGKVDIDIVLSGSYENIDKYMALIYSNEREINIESLKYYTTEDEMQLDITISAFAFLIEGEEYDFSEYNINNDNVDGKTNPYE
ncbi:MAG: type 4a pilus biogenesis protein PilO [Eubacteriaceae bacterium]